MRNVFQGQMSLDSGQSHSFLQVPPPFIEQSDVLRRLWWSRRLFEKLFWLVLLRLVKAEPFLSLWNPETLVWPEGTFAAALCLYDNSFSLFPAFRTHHRSSVSASRLCSGGDCWFPVHSCLFTEVFCDLIVGIHFCSLNFCWKTKYIYFSVKNTFIK